MRGFKFASVSLVSLKEVVSGRSGRGSKTLPTVPKPTQSPTSGSGDSTDISNGNVYEHIPELQDFPGLMHLDSADSSAKDMMDMSVKSMPATPPAMKADLMGSLSTSDPLKFSNIIMDTFGSSRTTSASSSSSTSASRRRSLEPTEFEILKYVRAPLVGLLSVADHDDDGL